MTASDHLKHRTGSLGGDQDECNKQKIPEWALREDGSLGNTMVPKLDRVQEHLASLASERYEKILELEREKIDLSAALAQKTRECEELRAAKDGAYSERDKLVALLSKVFPAWLERHPDADTTWDNDWRWIVFLSIPDQVSWHIHDSELWMFDHLERRAGNSWDGHTMPEKYARCQLAKPANVEQLGRQVAEMSKAATSALSALAWLPEDKGPVRQRVQEVIAELRDALASRARTK